MRPHNSSLARDVGLRRITSHEFCSRSTGYRSSNGFCSSRQFYSPQVSQWACCRLFGWWLPLDPPPPVRSLIVVEDDDTGSPIDRSFAVDRVVTLHLWWCVTECLSSMGWVGLGWVTKTGPMAMSATDHSSGAVYTGVNSWHSIVSFCLYQSTWLICSFDSCGVSTCLWFGTDIYSCKCSN